MGLAWCRGHVRATLRYGRGVAMAGFVGWIPSSGETTADGMDAERARGDDADGGTSQRQKRKV
jgi:hypothetical protein